MMNFNQHSKFSMGRFNLPYCIIVGGFQQYAAFLGPYIKDAKNA